ncbi:MAG: hypothetical protein JAY75_24500, partial [Candidatus Thiodiazotropha taylori]|nr:hypothetical protein [Candidatus Thiodiazotropha taylori]MCW4263466.1 hypothetical protein [Candidatus Thiodiazotropha endolucinida]MCG8033678.1 hypothetical protein [Candidatus Thiodiazotropha taylori]MCG8048848.1 hypothetical protein [Candidatus Thiodiazotropha taylori]MCG8079367.1 hypothetical protein [Candidatus Thiodiazotropha taylori]
EPVEPVEPVEGAATSAPPGSALVDGREAAFDRAVSQALKTSERRLSNQALFNDSRDVLGRAQAAESLADETLERMRQVSQEASQQVDDALGQLQDAPDVEPSEETSEAGMLASNPIEGESVVGRPVKAKPAGVPEVDWSEAFERLYGADAYDEQLRRAYGLQEMLDIVLRPGDGRPYTEAFSRKSLSRKGFNRGGVRPVRRPGSGEVVSPGHSPFQRQASIRGSLDAPKASWAERQQMLGTQKRPPKGLVERLGLENNPWDALSKHMDRYGTAQEFKGWLARNRKVATPDTYHEYLRFNHNDWVADYAHDYGQKTHGYYQQVKLKGINDNPAELMDKHQQKWRLKPRYTNWLKGRGGADTPKAYHDFVRETQAKPLYKKLGYVM